PPLTLAELRAIQDRNPGQRDVLALLWELQRAALGAAAPAAGVRRPKAAAESDGPDLRQFAAGLAKESCVLERDQMTAQLLESPRRLRKAVMPVRLAATGASITFAAQVPLSWMNSGPLPTLLT
ncbi:hypothetical protein, partial [Bordetella trematum]|uniref:hypothetical protein n=1 Tax=Bordetella trematum TaxID=123899 RepID=UPI002E256014